MNPQEPVVPETDVPPDYPSNPVEEPPIAGEVGAYDVSRR